MAKGGALPSVMNHDFSKIPAPQLMRSSFDKSRGYKTTFGPGYLVPVFLEEVLPGDTKNMRATFFARIATLLNPIMDNMYFDTFWFFTPNRLVWDNWVKFQGERTDPDDSIDFTVPVLEPGEGLTIAPFSLGDYFGLPVGPDLANDFVQCLPFRMYNLIWNEWFRDQNSQDSAVVDTDDGSSALSDYVLRRRGKRHDYFTSCLPFPQKGDNVSIPLGTSAPVIGDGLKSLGLTDNSLIYSIGYDNGTGFNGFLRAFPGGTQTAGAVPSGSPPSNDIILAVTTDASQSGLVADLSGATAATINDLRYAFATQQLLELDARAGTRYTEILKGHFGVTVPDFRLQRPEYLGGSSQRINVSAVPQTSESGSTPQANLAAFGTHGSQSGFVKSFDEHGYVMCLVNVRADITYQQGLARHWSRESRYDFYMPVFAHLGEQAVLNKEIFFTSANPAGVNDEVFGYQERWAEYRYGVSQVTGAFRSDYATSLDSWHLALDFSALPVLDDGTFIQDNPPFARVTAVGDAIVDGEKIILDAYFKYRDVKVMPVYSVPGLTRL